MDTTVHRSYAIPKTDNTDLMDSGLWRQAIIAIDTDIDNISGAWTAFVPVLTAAGTSNPANFTCTGRYKDNGKTVDFTLKIQATGTSTFGNGTWKISLPTQINPNASYFCTGFAQPSGGSGFPIWGQILASLDPAANILNAFGPANATDNHYAAISHTGVAGVAWTTSGVLLLAGRYEKP